MTPLRQFKGAPQEVIRKAEDKIPVVPVFQFKPPELGGLIGIPNGGHLVYRLVHNFPKLQHEYGPSPAPSCASTCPSSPISGEMRRFTVALSREDVGGEIILFHGTFVLGQRYAEDEHNVTITMPIFEPPNYYIPVVPHKWSHAETRLWNKKDDPRAVSGDRTKRGRLRGLVS